MSGGKEKPGPVLCHTCKYVGKWDREIVRNASALTGWIHLDTGNNLCRNLPHNMIGRATPYAELAERTVTAATGWTNVNSGPDSPPLEW